MQENSTYRIRAKVGDSTENVINVKLDQHYDMFEILSLKIDQENFYKTYESDYGVIVGRVIANGGFGVPNAKVSVFIESDGNDDIETRFSYPYKSPNSKNADGIRYNLLTDFLDKACYQNVGTFPNKRLVLDNDDVIDVFDKYYRYTTVTNNAGDYMIFGVPTGSQRLHVDVDLSDIGMLSQRPRDMIYKGYDINLFESPNKFRQDTNLNSLAQILTQDIGVYVYPYWGDTSDDSDNIAVTRADIQLDYKFEPTCVFMGSIITDTGSNAIGKNCTSTEKLGKMSELIAGEGSIEMIRKTYDGKVEEFQVKGNRVIDGDGVWCYQIPMNLDYIMTDEFGNIAPSDNPEKGIPTRTRVRFRISIDDAPDDNTARKRCRYLVPNNPRLDEELYPNFTKTKEVDYEFGTLTKNENYRDLLWNKVYTVKNYVPRLQKNRKVTDRKHTGIKLINHHDANNPMPYNNVDIKLGFTYRLLCVIFKIFINLVQFLNQIFTLLSLGLCAIYDALHGIAVFFTEKCCFKIPVINKRICPLKGIGKLFQALADLFWAMIIPCVGISSEMCGDNTTHNNTFFPGCGNLLFSGASAGSLAKCIEKKTTNSLVKKEDKAIKNGEMDESERTKPILGGTEELYNCVETALAEDNDVISLNFQNDWVNGALYAPMWFRKITKKRSYFFGLIKRRAKDQWCEGEKDYARKILRVFNPCSLKRPGKVTYDNFDGEKTTAQYVNYSDNKKYKDSCRDSCHKSTQAINLDKGLIIRRQTMLGQDVYYYKPVEFGSPQESTITNSDDFAVGEKGFGNGSVKLLFATDIVLLGSLNDCDIHGVPQFFKSLESTTFQIPPNILFADNEITVTMKSGGRNGDSTDDRENVNVEYEVTESSVSEMTGMDWGNFNEDLCGGWKDSQDSGLFYSIGCSTIKMKPKSCINMTRICEYGVSLDETKAVLNNEANSVSSEDSPSDDVMYSTIVPDGFVSKDELYNDDERSLFATLNVNGLATSRNKETGLMEYTFKHVVVDNFEKSLYAYMAERQSKCGSDKTQRFNYALEEFSKGYYDFRMGKKPYYYDKESKLPRYENSFYFFFGLHPGKTAIDKFNSQFMANCANSGEDMSPVAIEAVANDWCAEVEGKGNGYVLFDLSAVDLPCDIIIQSVSLNPPIELVYEDVDDDMFYIGNQSYMGAEVVEEIEEKGYVYKPFPEDFAYDFLPNGTYSLTLTDNNGEIINVQFSLKPPALRSYILGTDFEESDNVLMKEFRTREAIEKYKECIVSPITINSTRGIGGTIAISAPYNSKTGEKICEYTITIDSLTPVYEGGSGDDCYHAGIKCKNWCPNGGSVVNNDPRLLAYNEEVFIFGVPKGNVTYKVTITELCDGNASNNIYVEYVTIKELSSFKLYINGVVDYDVIKHWKSGFDCDTNSLKVKANGNISNKWWNMSDKDNYLWFNYIPYMDADKRLVELLKQYKNAVGVIIQEGYGSLYNSLKDGMYESERNQALSIDHFLLKTNITISDSNDSTYTWSPAENPNWERNYLPLCDEDGEGRIKDENDNFNGIISNVEASLGNMDNFGSTFVNKTNPNDEISWEAYSVLDPSQKEQYVEKTKYELYLECKEKGYVTDYGDFETKFNNGEECYITNEDCKEIVERSIAEAQSYEDADGNTITQEEYDALGYTDGSGDTITQEQYDSLGYWDSLTGMEISESDYENLGYYCNAVLSHTITQEQYNDGDFGYISIDYPYHALTQEEYDALGYSKKDDFGFTDTHELISGENSDRFPDTIDDSEDYENLGYVYIKNGNVERYASKEDYDNGNVDIYKLIVPIVGNGMPSYNEWTKNEYDNAKFIPTDYVHFILRGGEIDVDEITWSEFIHMSTESQQNYEIRYDLFLDGVTYHLSDEETDECDFNLQNLYVLAYEYEWLGNYYDNGKEAYNALTASNFTSFKENCTPLSDNYHSLKEDYEPTEGSSYDKMTMSGILDCWRSDGESGEDAHQTVVETIESIFNALIDINEEIIELLMEVYDLKNTFIDETKKAFQLYCPEYVQNIFFVAETKHKPVKYHAMYRPEMINDENGLYTLEENYIYTDDGETIDYISIPTITFDDSERFGNKLSDINNGLIPELCYASDNASYGSSESMQKKGRKLCNFIAVINSHAKRIPNDVEPLENGKCIEDRDPDVKLTKKYFGYHIIDKIFELNYMAWSSVNRIPYYKPLRENTDCIDENKAGVSMCMGGLFTGKMFNGNSTKNEPLCDEDNPILYNTRFEEQYLGENDIPIYTGLGTRPGESVEKVEDRMPTRRYVVGNNTGPYIDYRVTNTEDTADEAVDDASIWDAACTQQHKQYVPVVNTEMEMIIHDRNDCELNETIDGRMQIVLESSSVNLCSTKLKNRRKGSKLNVRLDFQGQAQDALFLVFSGKDGEYPLNLTQLSDSDFYTKPVSKTEFEELWGSGVLDPDSPNYDEEEASKYFIDDGYNDNDANATIDNVNEPNTNGELPDIYKKIDEEEYASLSEDEQGQYTRIYGDSCKQVTFDCQMTTGAKKYFGVGDKLRNLFSYYNNVTGFMRWVSPLQSLFSSGMKLGEMPTVDTLSSKYVDEDSQKEKSTDGFSNTGEFTFDKMNQLGDAYYIVAVTDKNTRTISPVYDFSYVCSKLIFGIVYTAQETTDESGAVNGYDYVSSPKATFDIANVIIKKNRCDNKIPSLNSECINKDEILYYFYYYPYDISFDCKIDDNFSISGSYTHVPYKTNKNGYKLFDIDVATYNALLKTYKNSNQKVGKTIRKNTTILATDYTGLVHNVDWSGCKDSDESKKLGCGYPYDFKVWVQITWVTNCGVWTPSEGCDKYVDIDGGGCGTDAHGEYENEYFGTTTTFVKTFEVCISNDCNDGVYEFNPWDVGDLEKATGATFKGWAESYDSDVSVPNESITLRANNADDVKTQFCKIYYALWDDDFVTVRWEDCFGQPIGSPQQMRPGTIISETEMNSKRPGTQSENAFKEWKFYNGDTDMEDSSLVEYVPGVGYVILPDSGDCSSVSVSEIVIKATCMQDLGPFNITINNYVRWRSIGNCTADGPGPTVEVFKATVWDEGGTNERCGIFTFNKTLGSNIQGPTTTTVSVNLVQKFGGFCTYEISLIGLYLGADDPHYVDSQCASIYPGSGEHNYLDSSYYSCCQNATTGDSDTCSVSVFVDGEVGVDNAIKCTGSCDCYEDDRNHVITLSNIDYSHQYSIDFFDYNGGSLVKHSTLFAGELIEAPNNDPTREGYTFNGWGVGINGSQIGGIASCNDTFYGNWVVERLSYKFIVNGQQVGLLHMANAGDVLNADDFPTDAEIADFLRAGDEFNHYWQATTDSPDVAPQTICTTDSGFSYTINRNTTFTAVMGDADVTTSTTIRFSVRNSMGGNESMAHPYQTKVLFKVTKPNSSVETFEKTLSMPSEPGVVNDTFSFDYQFEGISITRVECFTLDEGSMEFHLGSSSGQYYYNLYYGNTQITNTNTEYTPFDYDDNKEIKIVLMDDGYTPPPTPTIYVSFYNSEDDLTQGASPLASLPVDETTGKINPADIPTPSLAGYTFTERWGKLGEDNRYSNSYFATATFTYDTDFYAIYLPNMLSVLFDYNSPEETDYEGNTIENPPSQNVAYEGYATPPEVPELRIHSFDGWVDSDDSSETEMSSEYVSQSYPILHNTTFMAYWSEIPFNTYTMNWRINNHSKYVIHGISFPIYTVHVGNSSLNRYLDCVVSGGDIPAYTGDRTGTEMQIRGLTECTYITVNRGRMHAEYGGQNYMDMVITTNHYDNETYLTANTYNYEWIMNPSQYTDKELVIDIYDAETPPTGPFTVTFKVRSSDNSGINATLTGYDVTVYGGNTVPSSSIPSDNVFLNAIGANSYMYELDGWLNGADPATKIITENTTFTRLTAKKTFTVTFQHNNGTGNTTVLHPTYGEDIEIIAAPSYSGHTFDYWSCNLNSNHYSPGYTYNNVVSDMVFTAHWQEIVEPETVDLTFVAEVQGSNPVVSWPITTLEDVEVGHTLTQSEVPTEQQILAATPDSNAYNFIGWDGGQSPAGTTVSASITTYKAYVEKKTYTVTFKVKDDDSGTTLGTISTITVEHGDELSSSDLPNNGAILNATGNANAYDIESLYWKVGNTYTDFDGGATVTITSDKSVYAMLTKKVLTVKYVHNNGTGTEVTVSPKPYYGDTITINAAPTYTGYNFNGWKSSLNNQTYQPGASYTVKDNVTFTAQWAQAAPDTHTVTFVFGHGQQDVTQTVNDGETAVVPSIPNVEGYHFKQWDNDVTQPIHADTTFTAVWQIVVIFKAEGSTISTQNIDYNGHVTIPTVTVGSGRRFKDKWTKEGHTTQYSSDTVTGWNIQEPLTLVAVIVDVYTVEFYVYNNGTESRIGGVHTVESGNHVTPPDDNAISNAISGTGMSSYSQSTPWRISNANGTFNTYADTYTTAWFSDNGITSNMKLFLRTAYSVTFDFDQNGMDNVTQSVEQGHHASVPTPGAVENCTFTGWSSSVSGLNTGDSITSNVTFTAQWDCQEPQTGYTVTFYKCDGSVLRTDRNVPAGTVYGTTSGYNYPSGEQASTFSNGQGCMFGGAWTASPLTLNGIQQDTAYTPVCSCSGNTYTITLAVKNAIDTGQPNQQYYLFSVENYSYTLYGDNGTYTGSTSISGTFNPGTYREVNVNGVQAFSEISIDVVHLKYNTGIEEDLYVNGGTGMYGHVATAYLYQNGNQYGQAPNINRIPFASTQNGIALTVVVTRDATFNLNKSGNEEETE